MAPENDRISRLARLLDPNDNECDLDLDSLTDEECRLLEKAKRGLDALQKVGRETNRETPVGDPESDTFRATSSGTVHGVGTIGRFEIIRVLGEGGHGTVLLAYDPKLDRQVALKVPNATAVADDEIRQRFIREARAAAILNHPAIVPVFESGSIGPAVYIVYRYCPGSNLSVWLEDAGRLESLDAAAMMLPIVEAVSHAHQRGVVHRDLKPSNILLETDRSLSELSISSVSECLRIADFGLAKIATDSDSLTRTHGLLGTPAYMSPEQAEGNANAGPPSDIYSLGVILYELLTGRPPHQKDGLLPTLRAIVDEPIVPPRKRNPNVHRDLDLVCMACLQKSPSDRYGSAFDLMSDLVAITECRPISLSKPTLWQQVTSWVQRNPILVQAAAAAILVSLVSLGLALRGVSQANQRARGHLDRARKIVEDFFVVTERELAGLPGDSAIRKSLSSRALNYFEEFEQIAESGDRDALESIANSRGRLAVILRGSHDYDASERQFRKTIDEFRRLRTGGGFRRTATSEDLQRYSLREAEHIRLLANLFGFSGKFSGALEANGEAIEQFQELEAEHPADDGIRFRRWQAQVERADILNALHDFEAALEQSHQTAEEVDSMERSDFSFAKLKSGNLFEMAHALSNLGEFRVAEQKLESALRLISTSVPTEREQQRQELEKLQIQARLRYVRHLQGAPPSGEEEIIERVEALERLVKLNPNALELHEDYAVAKSDHAMHLQATGHPEEAIQAFEDTIALMNELIEKHQGKSPYLYRSLGVACNNLALVHFELSQFASSAQWLERAIQASQHALEYEPESLYVQGNLVNHHFGLTETKLRLGVQEEALAVVDEAIRLSEKLCDSPRSRLSDRQKLIALLATKLQVLGTGNNALAELDTHRKRLKQFILLTGGEKYREHYRQKMGEELGSWLNILCRIDVEDQDVMLRNTLSLIPQEMHPFDLAIETLQQLAEKAETDEDAARVKRIQTAVDNIHKLECTSRPDAGSHQRRVDNNSLSRMCIPVLKGVLSLTATIEWGHHAKSNAEDGSAKRRWSARESGTVL